MNELKIQARAKINIALDVLGKREDGYHNVRMIMQQVNLYDNIHIKKIKKGIELKTDCEYLPVSEGNIAYQAAKLMFETFNLDGGVEIYIQKNIPVSAGLAGGSTDAAAVLNGINKLWQLGIEKKELMGLGKSLGADVPFCIRGGAALAEGIGEKLTPIKALEQGWVVLAKPNISVSTADVYKKLDLKKINEHPQLHGIIKAMEENDLQTIVNHMFNVLESVTEKTHPIIKDIKRKLCEYHALGSMMSGSGPTVFGFYRDYQKAKSAYENLKKVYKQTYVVKTYKGEEFYE